jgi:hypothetical protein
MRKAILFLLLVALLAAATYGSVLIRRGFSAREQPSVIEALIATTARSLALPSSYRNLADPVQASPESIRAGMEHLLITAPLATAMTAVATRCLETAYIRNRRICERPKRRATVMANCTTSSRTGCG